MRVFAAITLIVLLFEAVLVAAYLAGLFWLGGWMPGALLCLVVFVLLILPWIGDLEVDYDSRPGQVRAKLSWWGGVTVETAGERQIRGRFLLIPWRRSLKGREPKPHGRRTSKPSKPKTTEAPRDIAASIETILRMAASGAHMGADLIWDSQEISVRVQSPSQVRFVDELLARHFGSRSFGPIDLEVSDGEQRHVEARYRIGLFRAALAGMMFYLRSRPGRRPR